MTSFKRLAKYQPVFVVLDQLDALAGYLDLRTARLSVLLSLVRRLGGTDNVHIVLSSRPFEFQHDVRLQAVAAESLSLELPAWSQVLKILEARGVSATGWPEDAQGSDANPPGTFNLSLQFDYGQTSDRHTQVTR